MNRSFCHGCFEKQLRIDQLEAEVQRLKQQLRYRERQAEVGFFGSSTPSAQIPLKPNTPDIHRANPGGAKLGHPGHGRKPIPPQQADRVDTITLDPQCPDCGSTLQHRGVRLRSVIDTPPLRAERIVYRLEKKYCPQCDRYVEAKAPGVLPKSLLGNQLITRIVLLHYRDGIPLGTVCHQLGIALSTALQMLNRLAGLFKGIVPYLIQPYRQEPVRHAEVRTFTATFIPLWPPLCTGDPNPSQTHSIMHKPSTLASRNPISNRSSIN